MLDIRAIYGRKTQATAYVETVEQAFRSAVLATDAAKKKDDKSPIVINLFNICQEQYGKIFKKALDKSFATQGMETLQYRWNSDGISFEYSKGQVTITEVSGRISRMSGKYLVTNIIDTEMASTALDGSVKLLPHGALPKQIADASFNIVYGGPKSGKTLLAASLAGSSSCEGPYISVGEPSSSVAGDVHSIVLYILIAGLSGYNYIYVDSLRTVINEMDGKLRKGGLAREFDTVMTMLSALCMRARVHAHGVINPSDASPEVVAAMQSHIQGAVTTLIVVDSVSSRTGQKGMLQFNLEVESRTSARANDEVKLQLANAATVGIIDGQQPQYDTETPTTINDI